LFVEEIHGTFIGCIEDHITNQSTTQDAMNQYNLSLNEVGALVYFLADFTMFGGTTT
jgi:hypothetical protein